MLETIKEFELEREDQGQQLRDDFTNWSLRYI